MAGTESFHEDRMNEGRKEGVDCGGDACCPPLAAAVCPRAVQGRMAVSLGEWPRAGAVLAWAEGALGKGLKAAADTLQSPGWPPPRHSHSLLALEAGPADSSWTRG